MHNDSLKSYIIEILLILYITFPTIIFFSFLTVQANFIYCKFDSKKHFSLKKNAISFRLKSTLD